MPPLQRGGYPSRVELIDRIAAAYGVDRARATEGADLYLLQLRRTGARTGD